MTEEEKIIQDLLAKGNKQVVEWITKLDVEDLYQLLAQNISYKKIIELIKEFKKDFEQKNDEW
jgi:uncharacterized protein YeeX (DUF496 family)